MLLPLLRNNALLYETNWPTHSPHSASQKTVSGTRQGLFGVGWGIAHLAIYFTSFPFVIIVPSVRHGLIVIKTTSLPSASGEMGSTAVQRNTRREAAKPDISNT